MNIGETGYFILRRSVLGYRKEDIVRMYVGNRLRIKKLSEDVYQVLESTPSYEGTIINLNGIFDRVFEPYVRPSSDTIVYCGLSHPNELKKL